MNTFVALAVGVLARLVRLFHPSARDARFIVLLGGPGAGKGTNATKLSAHFGIPHLSLGNLIRREIAEATELGKLWGPRIKEGRLLPDSVALSLLRAELRKPEFARGAVLDGFPRMLPQAKALRWILAFGGVCAADVVLLQVEQADLIVRLADRRTCTNPKCARSYHLTFSPPNVANVCDVCGSELKQRDDETEEAVRTRMAEFDRTFSPLRRFYEKGGSLKVVTATNAMSPDDAFKRVLALLTER